MQVVLGRGKFMNSNECNENINEFEKEIADIEEWQNNQFNPGYYIGTGRVPKPISSLGKHPVILLVLGLISAIPAAIAVLYSSSPEVIPSILVSAAVPVILICGGIVRLIESKKRKKVKI